MNKDGVQKMVQEICKAAAEKKAKDIMTIDISQMSVIADAFVICSGTSAVQVKAICDNIDEKLKKQGIAPLREDGYSEARWVVLDYGDVLVHIFKDEDRLFYHLERLWSNGTNTVHYTEED